MIFWEIKQDLSNLFDAIINTFLHIGFPSLLSGSLPPAPIYGLLVGCHNSKQWSSWTTNSILGKKLNYRPSFLQKSLFLLTGVRSRATCESFHPVVKAVFVKSVLEPDSVIVTCQLFFSLDKIYSYSCCIVVESPRELNFLGERWGMEDLWGRRYTSCHYAESSKRPYRYGILQILSHSDVLGEPIVTYRKEY